MRESDLTPLDRMQRAIQLAAFHYIACLKATPTNADYCLAFERNQYIFESIRRSDSRALHVEFQKWAAVTVLRDLIEEFSIFLMESYGNVIRNKKDASFQKELIQFERRGIEDQLDIISKNFDIDRKWIDRLIGYNRARNCLAHRRGIVGARDVTDGNELVVRWLVSKAEIISEPATPFVEAVGPMSSLIRGQQTHGEKGVRLEVSDKEKRIPIGSRLEFLPTDILEICMTFQTVSALFNSLDTKINGSPL